MTNGDRRWVVTWIVAYNPSWASEAGKQRRKYFSSREEAREYLLDAERDPAACKDPAMFEVSDLQ